MDASVSEAVLRVEVDPFDYVRRGFAPPSDWRMNAHDLTAEQWAQLVFDETERVKPVLDIMTGFRQRRDVISKDLEPLVGNIRGYHGNASTAGLCRLMTPRDVAHPGLTESYYLLDRSGQWIVWTSQTDTRDGGHTWYAESASLDYASTVQELAAYFSRADPRYTGIRLLESIASMVRDSLETKRSQVQQLQAFQGVLGHIMGRLDDPSPVWQ